VNARLPVGAAPGAASGAARQAGAAAPPVLIEVHGITKVYGAGDMAVHALRGVSLTIRQGEFVAIMGPSGSGKSTFMHLLGCLDHPTSGTYALAGQEVSRLGRDELALVRNKRIGFVFQSFNLLARTSAEENVELPMVYAGVPAQERTRRAVEVLQQVGLGDRLNHLPSELSGGQQQRVAIGRALANRAPLLMADEPTGNLDSASSADIMALFRGLNRDHGITVVVVTHDITVAAWAERVVTFKDGLIIDDRPSAEVVPPEVRRAVLSAEATPEVHA